LVDRGDIECQPRSITIRRACALIKLTTQVGDR
jgi:hypothetical protein